MGDISVAGWLTAAWETNGRIATLNVAMADPLTLLILVAAGELTDSTTHGIAAAAREALGPSAHVVVGETRSEPDDAQALAREKGEHADAVVELHWLNAHHRRAALRVHLARSGKWVERQMTFRTSDADSERGRTLGLAIASILPEAPSSAAPEEATVGPPGGGSDESRSSPNGTTASPPAGGSSAGATASPSPSSASVPSASSPSGSAGSLPPSTARPQDATATAAPAPGDASHPANSASARAPPADAETLGSSTASSSSESPTESTSEPTLPRTALDLFLVGASGIDGGGQGLGGTGAVHWFATEAVSLRVGIAMRGGPVNVTEGNLLMLFAAAGLSFHPWRANLGHPFGISLRADYLFLYESLTHFAVPNESSPEVKDGVLSGADAVVDGEWLFTPNVEAVVGVGAEAFAPTFIEINGARVAALPLLRAVAEAGLRMRF